MIDNLETANRGLLAPNQPLDGTNVSQTLKSRCVPLNSRASDEVLTASGALFSGLWFLVHKATWRTSRPTISFATTRGGTTRYHHSNGKTFEF